MTRKNEQQKQQIMLEGKMAGIWKSFRAAGREKQAELTDHTFSFHTPVLDLIEGSVTNDFAMIDLFHGSAASDSEGDIDSSGCGDCHANYFHTVESVIGADSECFASVRDEPRFQSIAARVREMVPKAEVDKLLLSSVRVPRLRAFLKAKTE